jgi:hypothetical protein
VDIIKIVRMAAMDFEFLLNRIAPSIVKQNTFLWESILIQERLALTLRFLAMGDSNASLQCLFKILKQSIRVIVRYHCYHTHETWCAFRG